MAKPPRSLRTRIILAFLILGGVLGPLLATSIQVVNYTLEERNLLARLELSLTAFIERTRLSPDLDHEQSLDLELYRVGNEGAATRWPILKDLPLGAYEVTRGAQTLFVVGRALDGARYYAIHDGTAVEAREHHAELILIASSLLSVYAALWLGYWLSGRLVAPVRQLAEQVQQRDIEAAQPLATTYPNDEIGVLARALDSYADRLNGFLRREREFAADVSHELRTPLTVMQGVVELALDQEDDPRKLKRLQRMERATHDMLATVNALLEMVRERRPDSARADIATVLHAALEAHQPLLAGRPVEVSCRIVAHPQVAAPEAVVAIVIGNLLRNALTYTGRGTVEVVLGQETLTVVDSGVGMEACELPGLFERGTRGSNHQGHPGAGLGLSIVRRICERYGWNLQLRNGYECGAEAEWRFTPALDANFTKP